MEELVVPPAHVRAALLVLELDGEHRVAHEGFLARLSSDDLDADLRRRIGKDSSGLE